MRKGLFLSALSVLALAAITGCPSRDTRPQRVSAQQDTASEGVGVGSSDIITMADKLHRTLLTLPEIFEAEDPPTIVFLPVNNFSDNSTFNTSLLRKKVQNKLIMKAKGKVRILSRDNMKEVMAERQAKRDGAVTTSGLGSVRGADFFIRGSLDASSTQSMSERGQYTLITFEILDAETTEIVAIAEHEFKKVQDATGQSIYR